MKNLLLFLMLSSFLFTACNDDCDDITCMNDAACDDGTCICTEGFEGNLCETKMNEKFLGNYHVAFNCTQDSDSTVLSITAGTLANEIRLAMDNVQFDATVDGTEMTIPQQTYSDVNTTVNFSETVGRIDNNTISIQLNFEEDNMQNNCTIQGDKL